LNQPKLFVCLRDYKRSDLTHDLTAGITVGLVALPLAMAFAIASGVKPEAGIYTAVIAGFIISALGGSSVQIGGPTGAFVVIVAGIVAKFGLSGLMMVTMMAGVLLLVMGLTGLGRAVEFIPRPVTIGFTNGIAVLIASTHRRGRSSERVSPSHETARRERGDRGFCHRCCGPGTARAYPAVAQGHQANSRNDRGVGGGYRGDPTLSFAGCNHRHALRRNPHGLTAFPNPRIPSRSDSDARALGAHGGITGRD
jgi:hypothetical protein